MAITHTTTATSPNDPTKEVSSDAWNAQHTNPDIADVNGLQAELDALASSASAVETVRNNIMVPASTSIGGGINSPYEMLVTKYGNYLRRGKNGGRSGRYAKDIADSLFTGVINQKPAFVYLACARNDMGGGSPTDPATEGTGGYGNALYYLPRIIAALRARGIKVVVVTEPVYQAAGSIKTNLLAWNANLRTYIPSLNDSGVILSDLAAVISNTTTGAPTVATIATTATGTSGTNTITVASATGITRGMHPYSAGGAIVSSVGKPRVIGDFKSVSKT